MAAFIQTFEPFEITKSNLVSRLSHDWRQRVLTLWPCGMEQSSSASAERKLHPIIRLFQKTLEDGPAQTDPSKIIIQ